MVSHSMSSVDGRFFRGRNDASRHGTILHRRSTRYKYKYIKIYALGMYVDRELVCSPQEMETEKKFELLG